MQLRTDCIPLEAEQEKLIETQKGLILEEVEALNKENAEKSDDIKKSGALEKRLFKAKNGKSFWPELLKKCGSRS